MDAYTTHSPWGAEGEHEMTTPDVTRIIPGNRDHIGDLAFLIGGIIGGVLLLMLCVLAVLLWCMSRQKGSYVTNELDEDDDERDEDDDGDDESVSSGTALRSREALAVKGEE